jgi:regulator of sigma E protease
MDATLYDPPVIGAVEAGSPAAQAGFLPADRIVSINQTPQKTWEDALLNIVLRPGTTLEVRVRRGDEEKDLRLAPKTDQQSRTAEPGVYPLVRVGTVEPGLPAASAGVTFDDGILEIDGKPVRSFGEIPSMIAAAAGRPLALKLLRGDRVVELIVTPRGGRIGISNKRIVRKLGWLGATSAAWGETWRQTRQILTMLKGIVTAKVSARASLSGPIGIAMASGDAVRRGVLDTILLLAMVSIGVGLLNLFPLAPLDGGHLAILAAEGVIRRDLSVTVKTWIMNLGVAVVLLLVVVTLYSDLSKTAWLSKYLP